MSDAEPAATPSPPPPVPAPPPESAEPVVRMRDRRGRVYTPAIGPKLKALLLLVFAGVALLGANSVYLAGITVMNWWTGSGHETFFYYLMFALHLALGLALTVPFAVFASAHMVTAWKRPNRAAVRYGLLLLASSIVVIVTGVVLWRNELFEVRDPRAREIGYWLHVAAPVLAAGLYLAHRFAGPRVKWGWARAWVATVAAFVIGMGYLHSVDPREQLVSKPREGRAYFAPSEAVTATGNFIPAETLMLDSYCLKCHKDAYDGWFHSAHHFSSFNNKAYAFSVRETRRVSMERSGNPNAARWCAGCHDPVPFFSGEFDDPDYDDVNTQTSQAGITCVTCHSIVHTNSTRGNADYVIEEPELYPWTFSENPVLQWMNHTLVKAKPEMHKRTFLKPLHLDNEFCSTCHKVHLPFALNEYKDFLRGQNHYDPHLLSGVSGHGARSFYYPPKAMGKCADCHMNLRVSDDFGARDFDGDGRRKIHDHLFRGANTGLATLRGREDIAEIHAKYLSEGKVRVDVFGLREGGGIEGRLLGPLRPEVPELEPGADYLVEVVVRTLGVGHVFTQGTADSNEVWVELIVRDRATGAVVGHSGGLDAEDRVDPRARFINVYMLDKDGNRIDRRNPQDIFTPLYNKQIPPGAGQVVHFGLTVPPDARGPLEIEARVNYRKFDRLYLDYIFGAGGGPKLPIVEMARDVVRVPIAGGPSAENDPHPIPEADRWQRWNDYGIGLLLEGSEQGGQKGELLQAEEAFRRVAELGRVDGWVNLARVLIREGRVPEAREALETASRHENPPYPWVVAWLNAQANELNGFLDEAARDYRAVLETRDPSRGFDFSKDYEVRNALGRVLYGLARREPLDSPARVEYLREAIRAYRATIELDTENIAAHYGLGLAHADLDAAGRRIGGLPRPSVEAPAEPVDRERLEGLAARLGELGKAGGDAGKLAALLDEIGVASAAFLDGPRPAVGTRMEVLRTVQEALLADEGRASAAAPAARPDDPATLARERAFAAVHKAFHRIYKPDETAEGRAISLARARDKAADQNAQSIVIHPLHHGWGASPATPKAADATPAATIPAAEDAADE